MKARFLLKLFIFLLCIFSSYSTQVLNQDSIIPKGDLVKTYSDMSKTLTGKFKLFLPQIFTRES